MIREIDTAAESYWLPSALRSHARSFAIPLGSDILVDASADGAGCGNTPSRPRQRIRRYGTRRGRRASAVAVAVIYLVAAVAVALAST